MDYPDSYYAHDSATLIGQGRVEKNIELPKQVDVIIVGGGFAGLTTALELARAGTSVVLFEAHKIGWGASGRNGGFVSAGFSEELPTLIKKLGRAQATALFALSHEGAEYVRREALSIDPSIIGGTGGLSVLRYSDSDGVARSVETYAELGIKTRHVPQVELRDLLKSNSYFDAIENEEKFHIQPLGYALGLAQQARAAGAYIIEDCPVSALVKSGKKWRVRAGGEIYDAQHLVLAGSSYMSGLYSRLNNAILPVATYVITTEPMGDTLDQSINYEGCISDTRRAGDYYRRLPDGRLLWGGRITTRRSEPKALMHMLKKDILKIYPQLGDFKISHTWSGLMGYAVHKMPIIAALEPGLWTSTGHGGHGLNTTAMAGQLIAAAIADGDDRWQQFAPFGPTWAGGIFGRMGTQAVYWYMQARDRMEERRSSA